MKYLVIMNQNITRNKKIFIEMFKFCVVLAGMDKFIDLKRADFLMIFTIGGVTVELITKFTTIILYSLVNRHQLIVNLNLLSIL